MKPFLLIIASVIFLSVTPTVKSQGVVRIQSSTVSAGACATGIDISNGWCEIAHTAAGSTNTTTVATSPGIDTTGADLLIVVASCFTGGGSMDITNVTDSKSNSWTQAVLKDSNTAEVLIAYSKPTTVGSSHTFTLTSPGTATFPTITVYAVSGSHATPLDQTNSASTASATSLATGSITPSENSCLVITGLSAAGTSALINSSMTISDSVDNLGGNHLQGGLAYITQSTAAAINPTWSWTTANIASVAIVSFKHS